MRAFIVLVGIASVGAPLCADNQSGDMPPAIRREGLAELQAELAKRITSAPARVMKSSGLAGAMGGVRVKVTSGAPQEILLPIPQLTGGQVPVCYFISSTPADAVSEIRLRKTEEGNVAVVHLVGKKQDVQITWSSIVLLVPQDITPDRTKSEPYRTATSCVQSGADEVKKLATQIWPPSGKSAEFAASIQRHVRDMKRVKQPRSLDAIEILRSGENSICTANANLASALMRSKGIACRSVAVLPPISQRLEMHGIVEFYEDGRWIPFDPSSLQADIPAKPWQSIVMAKTSVRDEQTAMKPRMGVMVGCPYGQEVELLTPGVMLFGQDFFWTMATPQAEFEPSEKSTHVAVAAWVRYLESGTLAPSQLKAGSAKTATEWAEGLKHK